MKRFAAFFSLVFSLIVAAPVYAQQPLCPKGSGFDSLCNLRVDKAGGLVGVIIQWILIIAILSSAFFLIWGGIRWISSGGDKGKIDSARGMLTAAIVGLIISLLAFFILNIVLAVITGQGLSNLSIPTLLQ
jgi:hypothetical protein